MEASAGRSRMRLLVVDFLATLFVTFCIGTATALVLGACVVLMAGDAHGATKAKPRGVVAAPAAPATAADLVLAHYFAAKYAGLVAVDRLSSVENVVEPVVETEVEPVVETEVETAVEAAAQPKAKGRGARGCEDRQSADARVGL